MKEGRDKSSLEDRHLPTRPSAAVYTPEWTLFILGRRERTEGHRDAVTDGKKKIKTHEVYKYITIRNRKARVLLR